MKLPKRPARKRTAKPLSAEERKALRAIAADAEQDVAGAARERLMKPRREGTLLELPSLSSDDSRLVGMSAAEVLALIGEISAVGISGLSDFLQKADELADQLLECPETLRAKHARALKHDVMRTRAALELGADYLRLLKDEHRERQFREVLYAAIGAGLAYGLLSAELRQDNAGLTRTEYFNLRKSARSRKELASLCALSGPGLRKWEDENGIRREKKAVK
jgi:hypothetical protein